MLIFKNLSKEEQHFLLEDAEIYYCKNKEKIDRILYEIYNHKEPTGSQLANPKEWLASHWNWFFSIRPINKKSFWESFVDIF